MQEAKVCPRRSEPTILPTRRGTQVHSPVRTLFMQLQEKKGPYKVEAHLCAETRQALTSVHTYGVTAFALSTVHTFSHLKL